MQKSRELQTEDFQMFLSWLGDKPDAACQKYEEIRIRLIKVFVCRGCADPEYLADETISRVVLRIRDIKDNFVGDAPLKYIYGVARNVYLEFLRQKRRTETALKNLRPSPDITESAESYCLNYCLEQLPGEQAQLFLDYYETDDQPKIKIRQDLAEKFKLDLNALRVKIFRIRHLLQDCIEGCLEKK
jgi:DNA-directed RNA polymerase specialized sigma24 family protein